MIDVMNHIRALIKYMFSFFKREWQLEDYPLRFFRDSSEPLDETLLGAPIRWRVHIINWWLMRGFGSSRDQALKDLRQSLARLRERGDSLPRPGKRVPIEIECEPRTRVASYGRLAAEFFPRILSIDADAILYYSDVSSLRDFSSDISIQELQDRIRQEYGVDVTDVKDGNLAAIFERISKRDAA